MDTDDIVYLKGTLDRGKVVQTASDGTIRVAFDGGEAWFNSWEVLSEDQGILRQPENKDWKYVLLDCDGLSGERFVLGRAQNLYSEEWRLAYRNISCESTVYYKLEANHWIALI